MSLRGELVYLRTKTLDDVKAMSLHYEDLYLQAHCDDRTPDVDWLATAKRSMGEAEKTAPKVGCDVLFAICALADDRLIGECAVHSINTQQRHVRTLCVTYDADRQCSVGRNLLPRECGQSFGTEALKILLEYCFDIRGFKRVELTTQHDNLAAQKSAEKAKFTLEGRLREKCYYRGSWNDLLIYGILEHEWRDQKAKATQ